MAGPIVRTQNRRSSAALWRAAWADLILIFLVVASCCIALTLGPARLSLSAVLHAVLAPPFHQSYPDLAQVIVWQVRLPRVLMAGLVGACLSLAGLGFQALLRNDLAEPYTTGVSAGSSIGATAVILLGLTSAIGGFLLPAAAFLSGIAVIAGVYGSARRGGRVDVRGMLLLGVVSTAFLWAVQTLLLSLAGQNADQVLRWIMGTLENADWRACGTLTVLLAIGCLMLASQAYAMNLYALGEISAQQLGLDIERFKRTLMIASSLLAAATVAFAGIIAFVGLVVPHIARRLVRTPDHRVVLPATIFTGALMMIWSDTIARIAFGGDRVPVGVITAFWGGPFFWWLLRRGERGK